MTTSLAPSLPTAALPEMAALTDPTAAWTLAARVLAPLVAGTVALTWKDA